MKLRWRFECLLMASLFIVLSAGVVLAQDQIAPPPPEDNSVQQADLGQQGYPAQPGNPGQQGYPAQQGAQQQDPPGRVARVQYMTGQVSMQPSGVNDWIAASMNRPLTTSDRIWTDKDSRAELNVGDGFIRMSSETSLTLTNVSDSTVQMELDQGTLNLTVRHLEKGEVYEIDTPNYAFTVMKTGVYRFDVLPSQDQSWVTVRSGYGEATGKGAAVRVNSGTQVRFSSGNSLQHVVYSAPARDGFEDWAQVRDKRLDDSLSARYVSPGVIGYQDLDANGTWATSPDYGPVWTPTSVPAGWAPYRYGQWTWIAPWGWTWVDSAPWGFAPFHYGRWVTYGGGWAWAPGSVGYWNPYYSPALVGWIGGPGFGIGFGWGGGWGFGIGIGFGWYPLGWGAPYYPRYCGWGNGGWYHGGGYVTAGYFHNVNVTNTHITNINNVTNNYYNNNAGTARNTNAIARNGVTSASKEAFTSGAAVNKVGGAVPASALNNAHTLNTANVNPTKSSVLGGQTPRTNVPSAASANRSVVTRATPPARAASFNSAQSATAHSNSNSNGNATAHGAANVGTSANAAHNGVNGANTGAHNTTAPGAAEHSSAGAQTEARANVPSNPATHNVPRPPSAGGSNNVGSSNGTQSHNVPRPPTSNDSFARPNGNTANSAYGHNATTANNQRNGVNNSTAPRASQPYTPGHSVTPQSAAPSHQSAPAAGNSQSGSHSGNSSSSGHGSASSVPRPPANYSYHAAPSYSASGAYGAGHSSYSGAGSRGYSSSPSYNSGRSYGSSTQGYSAGRSNGSSPTYTARNYGSAPSYGGRSAGSYSAPHASGGGSSHSSSGGGYHGGGGGGHSGGGGGHGGGGGGHR